MPPVWNMMTNRPCSCSGWLFKHVLAPSMQQQDMRFIVMHTSPVDNQSHDHSFFDDAHVPANECKVAWQVALMQCWSLTVTQNINKIKFSFCNSIFPRRWTRVGWRGATSQIGWCWSSSTAPRKTAVFLTNIFTFLLRLFLARGFFSLSRRFDHLLSRILAKPRNNTSPITIESALRTAKEFAANADKWLGTGTS